MFFLTLADGAELRPLEPWQAAEFFASIDRMRAHLEPWIRLASVVTDEESARRFLQDYADRQARDEGRIYGIWIDGELAGGTLFRVFDTRAGVCEVGVWLAPEAGGRGLITTAARHMIDWAFGVRGMARVEWRTVPHNARSIAVAKRLGMTRDGVLRQDHVLNGARYDDEVWSLLAHEWVSSSKND
jgi:ribosomal-protein-serine acetyltransferase